MRGGEGNDGEGEGGADQEPRPGSAGSRGDSTPAAGSGGTSSVAGSTSSSAGGSAGAGVTPRPTGCERGTSVLTGHVTNARDLGGLPIVGGGSLACGAIYRGGPMKYLSPAGCESVELLELGTVIDLRIATEAAGTPTSDCVAAERVAAPLPIPYDVSPDAYLRDLNETSSIATIFRTFGDPSAYPIYFHCTFGRDRTGVVGALVLLTLGVSREDVMADYLLSQSSVGAYPDSLRAVLDEIEARGGPVQVLLEAGVTAEEIATLREQAIAKAP